MWWRLGALAARYQMSDLFSQVYLPASICLPAYAGYVMWIFYKPSTPDKIYLKGMSLIYFMCLTGFGVVMRIILVVIGWKMRFHDDWKETNITLQTLRDPNSSSSKTHIMKKKIEKMEEDERIRRDPLTDKERTKLLKHLDTLERSPDLEAARSGGEDAGKFVGTRELITGVVQEAAGGLQSFLRVDDKIMRLIKTDGEAAIVQECKESKDEEVVDLLNYIIHQTCSEKSYDNGIRDKGRPSTMKFEDFFANRRVSIAGLQRAHVIALRLCKCCCFFCHQFIVLLVQ